jgi:hypothetical protein
MIKISANAAQKKDSGSNMLINFSEDTDIKG